MNTSRAARWFDLSMGILRRYGVFIAATALITFGLFFLLNGRGEIAEAFGLITSISPIWIAVLAALQAIVLLIAGWSYQLVLRRQGYELGLFRLIEIHLRRVVIGAVTPVGGPASIYVLVRSLRDFKVKDSDALILAWIRSISGVLAFLLFLIPALLLQTPTTLVAIATGGLLFVLAMTLWMSVLVLRQGEAPVLIQRWAPARVLSFLRTAQDHRMSARDFLLPTLLSFFSHVTTAIMLFAGLQAVGYPAAIGTVLVGYVVGKLFFMMAPVFQGIGIVEIGMALALQQAGVPAAVAVSGALLFRVGDLWLPLSWGFAIQLVRMPLGSHLREAKTQATGLVSGTFGACRGLLETLDGQLAPLSRKALVFEAPLALTIGILVIVAAGLPYSG